MCNLVGAPGGYLRQLPAPLAAINLQHGLKSHRAEQVKTLEADDGRLELRAVTGPDYGRIWDQELVSAVMKIAGNGTGDTRWKVPGLLDWSTMTHNPFVEVTKDTTTLTRSKLAVCRMAIRTTISAASIAGIRKWARRRSAWRVSISVPSV